MTPSPTLLNASTISGIINPSTASSLINLQAEHNEASALLSLIREAQAKIDASELFLALTARNLDNYARNACYHAGLIERYTIIRSDLVQKYEQLSRKLSDEQLLFQ